MLYPADGVFSGMIPPVAGIIRHMQRLGNNPPCGLHWVGEEADAGLQQAGEEPPRTALGWRMKRRVLVTQTRYC